MKVLLITSKPPYPSNDGGCFASARLLDNLLDEEHEVHLLTIATKKHPFDMSAFPVDIQNKADISFVKVNTNVTVPGVVGSLFTSRSYNTYRFYNKQFENELIEKIMENNYQAIILDSLYATVCIDRIRKMCDCHIFIRTHNVEYVIWKERAEQCTNILKRRYFEMLWKKLKNYEIETLNKANHVLSISALDSEHFKNSGVTSRISDLPVSIRARSGSEYNIGTQRAFHLGSMSWKPNKEAVSRLINIWPNVNEVIPMATLHIAGSDIDSWKSPDVINVKVDGFIKDLSAYANSNGILVSPIRSGSGVNIKILEMMSYGVPVITTNKGAEGILDSNSLVIAETDEELTKEIIRLLSDALLEEEASKSSIAYIKKHHNPETVASSLTAVLND